MEYQKFIGVAVFILGVFAFALSIGIATGSLQPPRRAQEAKPVHTEAEVHTEADHITVAEVVIVAEAPGAGAAKRRPERAQAKSGVSPKGPGLSAPGFEPSKSGFKRSLPERESWGPVLRANTAVTSRPSLHPRSAETYTFTVK